PPVGSNYIDYDQIAKTNNLPSSATLTTQLSCMAAAGDTGCGFEMPLESGYRALTSQLPENAGFLRPDAILGIVFVTNEDDCSAPDDSDLFDPSLTAQYGFVSSYRCTNWGIQCGSPSSLLPYDAAGPFTNCSSAPAANGGRLTDINRYMNLLTL